MLVAAAACSATTSGAVMQGTPQSSAAVLDSVTPARANFVQVVPDIASQRVDVSSAEAVHGVHVPNTLKKPVLYPLRTASGVTVRAAIRLHRERGAGGPPTSRRAVVQLRRRERARFLEQLDRHQDRGRAEMGTIVHRAVGATTSGQGEGTLEVTTEWVDRRQATAP